MSERIQNSPILSELKRNYDTGFVLQKLKNKKL